MTTDAAAAAAPYNDVAHMRDAVFFDRPARRHKLSRFWLLLVLSAIIATAGVVVDSDATVIGAMIVAPLMTPILGVMLSVVLADWSNLTRSVVLVAAGAAAAIAVGFAIGLLDPIPVTAMDDPQVASRVAPGLITLLSALATGAVGSIALVRSDISDTLPGVAISISLVPPLTVVGLTLESHQPGQAGGAMILFLTNVLAILVAGVVVMALYRVQRMATAEAAHGEPAGRSAHQRRTAILTIVVLMAIVAVPLVQTSVSVTQSANRQSKVQAAVQQWSGHSGWQVDQITTQQGGLVLVRMAGPLPVPDSAQDKASLRALLEDHGVSPTLVRIELVPQSTIHY